MKKVFSICYQNNKLNEVIVNVSDNDLAQNILEWLYENKKHYGYEKKDNSLVHITRKGNTEKYIIVENIIKEEDFVAKDIITAKNTAAWSNNI